MKDYTVLVYNPRHLDEYLSLLRERAPELKLIPCETEADISENISKADILFVTILFPTHLIESSKRLKWIQTMGAGVERFTQDVTLPKEILLTRISSGFGYKIAEFIFAHLLSITQRLPDVRRQQKGKVWEELDLSWLNGDHMGIVGIGSIGSEIARTAQCFHMKVTGCARSKRKHPYFDKVYALEKLHTFLKSPKYVVLSLPLTKQSRGLIGAKELKIMRDDAYLINIARGPIVDEQELITALKEGSIQGAVLDVFEQEPLPKESPLWEMDNVWIAPHHSGPSVPEEIVEFFLSNVQRFEKGKKLKGVVDTKRGF